MKKKSILDILQSLVHDGKMSSVFEMTRKVKNYINVTFE